MLEALIGIIGSLLLLLLGWLSLAIRSTRARIEEVNSSLNVKLDDLNARKADHDTLTEIKTDIKQAVALLTQLQLEMAEWRGKQEARAQNKQDSY